VVRQRADTVVMPPPLAGWASTLDLAGLPDDLAESARSYLGRLRSLAPAAQAELGARIATAVAAVVTPPPPAGVPPWAYLSAVLAERSRRGGYGVAVAPVTPPAPAGYAAPPPAPPASPEPGTPPESPFAPPG
jgi:hypothetical protein